MCDFTNKLDNISLQIKKFVDLKNVNLNLQLVLCDCQPRSHFCRLLLAALLTLDSLLQSGPQGLCFPAGLLPLARNSKQIVYAGV